MTEGLAGGKKVLEQRGQERDEAACGAGWRG